MDFQTRQKLAVDEVNAVLAKYSVALEPHLGVSIKGIIPMVRLQDLVRDVEEVREAREAKEVESNEEPKKTKKGKK